jgi:peroxiredoxin
VLQVVDLQRSETFKQLDVQLVSIAPDPPEAWRDAAREYDVPPSAVLLSDVANEVANAYDVMKWAAATGEPGHTFILVDESGVVTWVKDYGALENGGIMYVVPDELVGLLSAQLGT